MDDNRQEEFKGLIEKFSQEIFYKRFIKIEPNTFRMKLFGEGVGINERK